MSIFGTIAGSILGTMPATDKVQKVEIIMNDPQTYETTEETREDFAYFMDHIQDTLVTTDSLPQDTSVTTDSLSKEQLKKIYAKVGVLNQGMRSVTGKDGKVGFVDGKGLVIILPIYDGLSSFSEGLVAFKKDGSAWGYMDLDKNVVILPRYALAFYFKEGLAAVKINGKWGFINKDGEMVIPAKYNLVNDFSDGVAGVGLDGKYGTIDKKGEVVDKIVKDNMEVHPENKFTKPKK